MYSIRWMSTRTGKATNIQQRHWRACMAPVMVRAWKFTRSTKDSTLLARGGCLLLAATDGCCLLQITDAHGNLQYIPFPTCSETSQPLSFPYLTPQTKTCTIDSLSDELYHLIEFFVHNDVPLSCRVPSYPLPGASTRTYEPSAQLDGVKEGTGDGNQWTPLTIALQGTLQLSHLHLHTGINVLFHTNPSSSPSSNSFDPPHLIASTAYSLPNTTSPTSPLEGSKIFRAEPLIFTFNVGWIDGAVLPGMVGRPVIGVKDHGVGFTLLSFFALAAAAGVGAMGMLVYERRKSGRTMNGLLGGNAGANGGAMRMGNGYGSGFGGYGGYNLGKRD